MTPASGTWIGFALVIATVTSAQAQSGPAAYPSQAVRIVVPVSPGSIADGFARLIGEKLAESWKQQVIVENRPGLAGTTSVAKSVPDGYGSTCASAQLVLTIILPLLPS